MPLLPVLPPTLRNVRTGKRVRSQPGVGSGPEHRAALHSRHEHTDDVTCRQHDAVRDRHLSADGFESTFAVNHLAPFLLTNLLLDRLRENAPARIVNVSSGVHGSGRIDLDDLQMERRFDGWAAYCNSEVAGVTGAYFVDRRRARASSATDDRRLAKELWRVSEALTGLA